MDGKEFRNLQEQVEWNRDKIIEHYARDRVLADFGIRIIGEPVSYTSQIPGYPGYTPGLKFGDAYLVSINADGREPYGTYAWTRTSPDATPEEGVWVDIGSLAIPGPQGIQGEPGPQGIPGPASQWYAGSDTLPSGDFTAGDMAILADGSVYRYDGQEWRYVTNIRGPQGIRGLTGPQGIQGIQGEQGPRGPVGPPASAIRILGTLVSVDYLPDPSTLSQADGVPAYLIIVGSEVRLYYIQGAVGEERWGYIPFTGQGTIVTTNGNALSTWDTNTKVDKTSTPHRFYGTDAQGNQALYVGSTSDTAGSNTIVLRTLDGGVILPEQPGEGLDESLQRKSATSKKYVDDLAATKVTQPLPTTMENDINYVFGTLDRGSSIIPYRVTDGNAAWTIPRRGEGSALNVGTPTADTHATTKKFVEEAIDNAVGSYQTAIITKVGTVGDNCRLNISDLTDLIPGTPVTIYASISLEGIIAAPPPAILSIGNNNLAFSQSQYLGIPYFTNDQTQAVITVFNDGTNFLTQSIVPISSASKTVTGTFIDVGIADGTGGQTILTVTYLRHRTPLRP